MGGRGSGIRRNADGSVYRPPAKTLLKRGGINLSAEERMVLEEIARFGGLEWFSYVGRTYTNRGNKKAEHYYPFDRILNKNSNELLSITEALKKIENEISSEIVGRLTEHEQNVYASLFERAGMSSKYVNVPYRGIFRNRGLFRRAVRWSAMDELADSFVNEDAKKLWNSEGYPTIEERYAPANKSPMEWFREGNKKTLSEEEFDRISEVFRTCINM